MEEDEWGKDPSVRTTRRVFAAIEAGQATLLNTAGLSTKDPCLRLVRKVALGEFEKRWAGSARAGLRLEENDVRDLYLHCLAKVLQTRGIAMRGDVPPRNPIVARILAMDEKR
jgi:hypothetical protein